MDDAVLGAPVLENADQQSIAQGVLTLNFRQQGDADPGLGCLDENGKVTGRDLRLDRDRDLLPPGA